MTRRHGFTLPEMLAALAVTAILLAMAAPALSHQRAASAVRAATTQTLSVLHLARRLALTRGQVITVCPSADDTECSFGGSQWMLFANLAGGSEARREAGEEILRRWNLPPNLRVSGTRGYAAFQPRPGAAATVTLEFCHDGWPDYRRSIVVSQTGRARLSPVGSGPDCRPTPE
jgi:type IV fimbrial biogenesis protein FimT